MKELGEAFSRLATDALRGTAGRDMFRMLSFELAKLLHQGVVFPIRDFRGFLLVVQLVVMTNFIAQRLESIGDRSLFGQDREFVRREAEVWGLLFCVKQIFRTLVVAGKRATDKPFA